MTYLIFVIGDSGSGKTTLCKNLESRFGYPMLVSHTTRPMRSGETDGIEHWFVDKCECPKENMIAYTDFGGYQYWAQFDFLHGDAMTYIIDEGGINWFLEHNKDKDIKYTCIQILRDNNDVDQARKERDNTRQKLVNDKIIKYTILNNTTIDDATESLKCLIDFILENQ